MTVVMSYGGCVLGHRGGVVSDGSGIMRYGRRVVGNGSRVVNRLVVADNALRWHSVTVSMAVQAGAGSSHESTESYDLKRKEKKFLNDDGFWKLFKSPLSVLIGRSWIWKHDWHTIVIEKAYSSKMLLSFYIISQCFNTYFGEHFDVLFVRKKC